LTKSKSVQLAKKTQFPIRETEFFLVLRKRFKSTHAPRVMSPRANKSKGEVVVNDSTVYCQSHRADRSIFSADDGRERYTNMFLVIVNNANFWGYAEIIIGSVNTDV